MSFFKQYRTPFGYVADGNQVDAYGVDHSNFSTRDEVEYQFARQEREKQMAEQLKQQVIEPENYPQLGATFWGNNPENNYGFGNSNISANIENRQNQTPLPNVGNANQNIWNRNQYQTPTPWAKQEINSSLDSAKPLYKNPQPKGYSAGDIALEALKGLKQGTIIGLESLANGATFGGYNWLNNKLNWGMQERRQDLQQAANSADVGNAFDLANRATEFVGKGLSSLGAVNTGIPAVGRAYNAVNIYKGTKNLEKQLERGNNFNDIYMGRIDRDKLNQINDIRQNVNEPLISSPQVKIHKNDVQHIWNRRINDGGSTPKDVANSLKQSVFSKDSQVFPGNVSRNQLMIKTGNKHPYMSIVSKDEAFDGVAIRSTMKKDLSTLRNKFPNLKFPNLKE